MSIRSANLSDLDNIVVVGLAAMPDDPDWHYRFPYYRKYPEDHLKYTRAMFEFLLNPDHDDWHVMVAEAPSKENPKETTIVAFAVWDVSYSNKRKHGGNYKPSEPMSAVNEAGGSTRKDGNSERILAFRNAITQGMEEHFNIAYGQDQIYLHLLETHPDHRRDGYGSALCKWGMSQSKDNGLVTTVMASPMGFLIYSHLGFKCLGEIVVQVSGEEEKVCINPMVFGSEE